MSKRKNDLVWSPGWEERFADQQLQEELEERAELVAAKPVHIPKPPRNPSSMTIKEAAEELGVSVRTVTTLVGKKQISFHKVRGSLRFELADLLLYCKKRKIVSK